MPPVLVLAPAPHAEAIARRITDKLSGLGYTVEHGAPATRRRQAAKIEAAHKVVLLWSRAARGTPALRAAARRARTKGTLVCVSLDAAPPPGTKSIARLPRSNAAWRRLLGPSRAIAPSPPPPRVQPRPARARRDPSRRIEPIAAPIAPRRRGSFVPGLLALGLLASAAGAEAYTQDASFAARINALAQTLAAQVAVLIGG